MKRINKIVPAFLNFLKVASYVSLYACSGNQGLYTAGDLLPGVKEPENVQNNEVSDESNEAEKNHDKLTNLLVTCQSLKEGNNKDKYAKNAKAKIHKKAKSSRHKRTESSIHNLKTTPILGDLSIVFDAAGKLKINNCPYRVKNEDEFKIFLEYLEKAKEGKKSINGLASIFPKAEKERKGNNDSVRLWKKDWFWKSINAHWDLFNDLNLQKFYIKSYPDATKKEKIFIEGLGLTDFLFSDIVNKKKDDKKEKTKTTTKKTVAEIKDEYNEVFQIKADHTQKKK